MYGRDGYVTKNIVRTTGLVIQNATFYSEKGGFHDTAYTLSKYNDQNRMSRVNVYIQESKKIKKTSGHEVASHLNILRVKIVIFVKKNVL